MEALNTDFGQRVVMHTADMAWQASPSPTVWRKRLDLQDGEYSRVTSVVRYDPASAFHTHGHPAGEEIFVLEGVFSDEHGDYPAGTYLLNPKGFRHTPFSRAGCVLFVKLCQYAGDGRPHLAVDTENALWTPGPHPGLELLPLYSDLAWPETMALERLAPGSALPCQDYPGGAEFFVLDGRFEDEAGAYRSGTWLRLPPGSSQCLASVAGSTYYAKRGHLAERPAEP